VGDIMVALVTGCAGFIGSHLVDKLIEMDFTVVGIDNLSTGLKENINPKCQFHKLDIRDPLIRDLFVGVDFVFHQAAMGSVPRSFEMPDEYKSVNVDGFYNVLRSCEVNGVKKLIYASSSSVYGDAEKLPKVENTIGKQLSPYSFTKRVNELMCEPSSIPTVGLRYFNVFGPRQRPDSAYAAVIPKWINAMLNSQTVTIHGDGSAFRDFTYVENVVQANVLAMLTETNPEIFNVGTGTYTLLNDLVCHIRNAIGLNNNELEIIWDKDTHVPITQSLASIEKINSMLKYYPEINLLQGIEKTVEWFNAKIKE
jgi:UDP-N-acetylglucosamine 4-epimerase